VSDLDAVFGELPETPEDYAPPKQPEVPDKGGDGTLTSEEFDSLIGAAARAVLRGS